MRSMSGGSLGFIAVLALGSLTSTVACSKVGEIQSKKAFKAANAAYQQQDYKKASDSYEQTIAAAPDSPTANQAYFFLGNSYDNQYKPSKKGDPANDALLTKAVENYQKAAEKLAASPDPADKKLGKLSLEYLVASYGADKIKDPAERDTVVQTMVHLEPA